MNREIIVRGKPLDPSAHGFDFVQGGYYLDQRGEAGPQGVDPSVDYHIIVTEDFEHIPVIQETIGQFTGLKDKHGKEIYEGDMREDGDWISYSNEWAKFGWTDGGYIKQISYQFPCDDVEITGNIHTKEVEK